MAPVWFEEGIQRREHWERQNKRNRRQDRKTEERGLGEGRHKKKKNNNIMKAGTLVRSFKVNGGRQCMEPCYYSCITPFLRCAFKRPDSQDTPTYFKIFRWLKNWNYIADSDNFPCLWRIVEEQKSKLLFAIIISAFQPFFKAWEIWVCCKSGFWILFSLAHLALRLAQTWFIPVTKGHFMPSISRRVGMM